MIETSVLLEESWQALRDQVNEQLERYLEIDDACPASLREAMAYSLMAGGKRLRPVLVLLACEACGGDVEAALPAACAVEMVHSYSLIHDDLPAMDDDELRRGRPTSHVMFGEAHAILAGDALLTLAFEIMARDVRPAEAAASCCADLASAAGAGGMVGGQVADLEAEERFSPLSGTLPALNDLEAIHCRKTGRLISSALTLGARIACADAETRNSLDKFGKCVGLAFQIADDLLDVHGDVSKMGKGVRKDADHGKLTYPSLLGGEASREMARELVEEACECLSCLGERSRRLEALAHFVIERDH